MSALRKLLERNVQEGTVPGAVALVQRDGHVDVQAAGDAARDSIFRVASLTKPITAAATMLLVDEGRIGLEDPVAEWLPELAEPKVVREPDAPLDDIVPAERAITVFDLLTSRAGYGFPSDFSLPAVQPLLAAVQEQMSKPQLVPPPDDWLAALVQIPMLGQPGEDWLYNTCSDILGVLVARVAGRSFSDLLAERLFEPLGMADTGFGVPAEKPRRLLGYYAIGDAGELTLLDPADGSSEQEPVFASGAGGLRSTVDDLHAFARMLLSDGAPILTPESVRLMTTDHLTRAQREASALFLEGQGWGFGGSVDVDPVNPWNVPGRYGWVGGTGTAAHVVPSNRAATILLTQVAMTGPTPTPLMREFWRYAAA